MWIVRYCTHGQNPRHEQREFRTYAEASLWAQHVRTVSPFYIGRA